jgi:hypothetical protein
MHFQKYFAIYRFILVFVLPHTSIWLPYSCCLCHYVKSQEYENVSDCLIVAEILRVAVS